MDGSDPKLLLGFAGVMNVSALSKPSAANAVAENGQTPNRAKAEKQRTAFIRPPGINVRLIKKIRRDAYREFSKAAKDRVRLRPANPHPARVRRPDRRHRR